MLMISASFEIVIFTDHLTSRCVQIIEGRAAKHVRKKNRENRYRTNETNWKFKPLPLLSCQRIYQNNNIFEASNMK